MIKTSHYVMRVFCPCGWSKNAPFGEATHAATGCACCLECGYLVKIMPVHTVRLIKRRKHRWNEWKYEWVTIKGKVVSTQLGDYYV